MSVIPWAKFARNPCVLLLCEKSRVSNGCYVRLCIGHFASLYCLPVSVRCSFEFSVKAEVMETCKLCVDVKNHVGPLQRSTQIRNLGSVLVSLRELRGGNGFTEW